MGEALSDDSASSMDKTRKPTNVVDVQHLSFVLSLSAPCSFGGTSRQEPCNCPDEFEDQRGHADTAILARCPSHWSYISST